VKVLASVMESLLAGGLGPSAPLGRHPLELLIAENLRLDELMTRRYIAIRLGGGGPIAVLGLSISLAGAVAAAQNTRRSWASCVAEVCSGT
jgi:hypothetical protein